MAKSKPGPESLKMSPWPWPVKASSLPHGALVSLATVTESPLVAGRQEECSSPVFFSRNFFVLSHKIHKLWALVCVITHVSGLCDSAERRKQTMSNVHYSCIRALSFVAVKWQGGEATVAQLPRWIKTDYLCLVAMQSLRDGRLATFCRALEGMILLPLWLKFQNKYIPGNNF